MNNIPSSSVPSIHILDADDAPALFEHDWLQPDFCNSMFDSTQGGDIYPYPQALQLDYPPSNISAELEEMDEFAHLATTGQLYISGPAYSLPYTGIMQENGAMSAVEPGLSPSSFASPSPSPSSSLGGSLSPSSFYDSSALSDTESPLSPSPTTPDGQFIWPSQRLSLPFIGSHSTDSVNTSASFGPQRVPHRPRSHSAASSRPGPVASKAMLEANSRRRRHPAQFECPECGQTFTALFSLKRHSQSHTGEKPFACSIPGCEQRFFNSSDCKRHEKSKKRHKDMMQ